MSRTLSKLHSWSKGLVTWEKGAVLHISVPFSWLVEKATERAASWDGPSKIGGPGLSYPTYLDDGVEPLRMHNPDATRTTLGCPNRCSFCKVWILEPEFKEIPRFRPAPIICDNNFTAASLSHQRRVVDMEKQFPYVDFNQGIEARRFTPELANMLGELRCKVRFAFDSWNDAGVVKAAIDLCRERTTRDIGVYCLIGYRDLPEDARSRLELVRSWGIRPNPMRYQPVDTPEKNSYVAPGWTEAELRKMMKYYARLRWYEHISYEEFDYLVPRGSNKH